MQNEKELHLSIGCFARLNAHLGLKLKVVNPAVMSVAKLVDVMARARIVVGVSGEHVRPSCPLASPSPSTSRVPALCIDVARTHVCMGLSSGFESHSIRNSPLLLHQLVS